MKIYRCNNFEKFHIASDNIEFIKILINYCKNKIEIFDYIIKNEDIDFSRNVYAEYSEEFEHLKLDFNDDLFHI